VSGKIIELVPGKKEHRCKGLPGFFRRVFGGIGAGSKWQCDDCKTIWVFEIDWESEWSGWLDTGKEEWK
jgi:hypothetical protein